MTSSTPSRVSADYLSPPNGARILLVNRDPRDLVYYGAMLRKLGCCLRVSSSFADGARCLEHELYDLIVLDQGDRGFEGHEVLARAMEVDPELRVLVLARSHDSDCYGEAMQSGALDCLEGPLNAAEMVALLETYLPSGTGSRRNSANLVEGAEPGEQCVSKAQSNHVHLEKRASGSYREQLQL